MAHAAIEAVCKLPGRFHGKFGVVTLYWEILQDEPECPTNSEGDITSKYSRFCEKICSQSKWLCIFVLAVGWVVCTGSVLAQIPPQASPEGSSCTVSYVQFLTLPPSNHTQLTVFQRATTAANATAKSLWHLGINPLNQAPADGFQDQTNKTKRATLPFR